MPELMSAKELGLQLFVVFVLVKESFRMIMQKSSTPIKHQSNSVLLRDKMMTNAKTTVVTLYSEKDFLII